jgi:glycosyltransferase involved in cell wall biosynthesis
MPSRRSPDVERLRAAVRPLTRAARRAAGWTRGAAGYVAGAPSGAPVVAFGQPVPRRTAVATGGAIKLQALGDAFAHAALRFNVLYLVSSRLPDGAVAQASWAKGKRAKLVVNQNGVAYPAWYGDGWQRENAPMAQLLAMADHVFYQSAFCKLSADRFAGPRVGSWEVLFNAVDTRRFSPAPQRSAGTLTLLLGGSQDSWYRVDTALQVVAALARRRVDVRLLVTGRLRWSSQNEQARRQAGARAAELDVRDRVSFLGPYTQADAPAIFRRADILLHTKYNDPCPAVVIEAMASGLPVVYSHSGGVPELVGDDAGIGVDAPLDWERDIPPDPEAMAEAALTITERQRGFADAARQRAVDVLDVDRWLARHRAVFESGA